MGNISVKTECKTEMEMGETAVDGLMDHKANGWKLQKSHRRVQTDGDIFSSWIAIIACCSRRGLKPKGSVHIWHACGISGWNECIMSVVLRMTQSE
jgi:hypothetical protein